MGFETGLESGLETAIETGLEVVPETGTMNFLGPPGAYLSLERESPEE